MNVTLNCFVKLDIEVKCVVCISLSLAWNERESGNKNWTLKNISVLTLSLWAKLCRDWNYRYTNIRVLNSFTCVLQMEWSFDKLIFSALYIWISLMCFTTVFVKSSISRLQNSEQPLDRSKVIWTLTFHHELDVLDFSKPVFSNQTNSILYLQRNNTLKLICPCKFLLLFSVVFTCFTNENQPVTNEIISSM